MNWYKRAQQQTKDLIYEDVGHSKLYETEEEEGVSLWIADGAGRNFQRVNLKPGQSIMTGHNVIWGVNAIRKSFGGRYDPKLNMVSLLPPDQSFSLGRINDIPEALIRRLNREFRGAEIMDFSTGNPEKVW